MPKRIENSSASETRSESARLVVRACKICEWKDSVIERSSGPFDCPWCHGPTELVRAASASSPTGEKNPHAAALGRLGGVKGGYARAAALSPKQRRAIAIKAAKVRWTKTKASKEP
jgi:hypothetical protein